jgi:hypothetical protein
MAIETSSRTYLAEGFGAHNSVAQHSVIGSILIPAPFKFEFLMHDTTEAYLNDVSRPLKYSGLMDGYFNIETDLWIAIARKYGLPLVMSPEVKAMDNSLCCTEGSQLIVSPYADDWAFAKHLDYTIRQWSPHFAKTYFLARFWELCPIAERRLHTR